MRLGLAALAAFLAPCMASGQSASPGDLVISYAPLSTGNQTALHNGDTISFPQTLAGASNTITIDINDHGTAPASVQSVSITGTGFAVSNVPVLPAQVAAGADFRFSVIFSPTAAGTLHGALTLTAAGASFTFTLLGTGTAPQYLYELVAASGATAVQANATILFPSTAVNASGSTVSLRITNTGSAPGTLANVSVAGNAFQISAAPIFPVTLAPSQNFTLTLQFSPTTIGTSTGRLRVENDQFSLSGIGLGSQITVTLAAAGANVPIAVNTVGLLPNTTIGAQLALTLQIANSGNQAGDLTFLSLSGPGFSLLQTPTLPVHLAAGDTLQVKGMLAPTTAGTLSAVLQVNDQAFTLRAVGAQPPALPAVTFTNITPTLDPAQQPSIGVQIATAYPYDLAGTLTLAFSPASFADDPSVQFSTGGRTAAFQIPANSTTALFAGGATQIGLQTGTTAGSIALSAAFSVAGYNLTQSSAPTSTATIAQAAPVIRSVAIANATSTGFQLVVTGYSTTRSITRLDFQLTPAAGATVTTSTLSADVSNAFTQWYQSAASLPFGTQFSVSVQFNIAGNMQAIGSVSVSAVSALGSSPAQSVSLN